MSTTNTAPAARSGATTAKITVAWALVGVPLLYGVIVTLTRVTALFTG
ncbi:hypothetical protein [Marisediminicola sp. LYQ134]